MTANTLTWSARRLQKASRFAPRLFMAAVALGLAAVACTTPADPVDVATIQLIPGQDSIEAGASASPFVVLLQDATGREITGRVVRWNSASPTIATVDEDGVVQGVTPGQTIITATADGKSATAVLKVLVPVTSILMTPESLAVPLTQTRPLNVQLLGPAGQPITNRTITFASGDVSVATVSTSGVVSAVAVGNTTVTATAGTKSAISRVFVTAEPVASVEIEPEDPVLIVRLQQSRNLTAQCLNNAGQPLTGRTVTWSSSAPLVASVNGSGVVSGLAVGQATITATCEGRTDQVVIQVTPVPVNTASVSPTQLTMFVGQQQQLAATAKDSADNVLSLQGRFIIWASDNLPVATVDGAGVVRSVSAGTANVTVTIDGVASAPVPVTVQNVPVASVQIIPLNPSVKQGQQIILDTILRDANNNVLPKRAVTWRSLDTSKATIQQNGIATALAVGTVTIEAEVEGIIGSTVLTITP